MKTRFLIVLIFALLATSGVFAVTRINSESTYQKDNSEDNVASAANTTLKESSKDSDGDDLEDWREVIYGTDPNKKDTDGDGVPDSEEPRVVHGQSAQTSTENSPQKDELFGADAAGDSATDRFSKMFISKYFAVKDSEDPLTATERAEVMRDAINALPEQNIAQQQHSLGDLNIDTDSSTTALRSYGNTLGSIVKRHSPSNLSNEYALVIESLHNEDPSRIEPLNNIVAGYRKITAEMISVSVPESAAERHLSLLNATQALSTAIDKMSQIYEEPIVGLHGLRAYPEHVDTFSDELDDLRKFFQQKGVRYQQGDDGYIFGITI